MSMRPRSSTWEWGAFADAMRYAKGSCDSSAAKRLFAATRASFALWLCRGRGAHFSIVTASRSADNRFKGVAKARKASPEGDITPEVGPSGPSVPVRLLAGGFCCESRDADCETAAE